MAARVDVRLALRACVLALLLSFAVPGAFAQSVRVVDLSVTKTDAPDPVLVGELITYNITVRNAGPDGARSVGVNDTLPTGTTFVSASAECLHAGGHVTCTIGNLASGASRNLTIVVRADTAGQATNQVRVTMHPNDVDTNLGNNAAVAVTTVVPYRADLGVTKSASPASVKPGGSIVYDVVVTNAGPQRATNVTLTDTLPEGVTATEVPSGCAEAAGVITCDLGSLPVEGEVRLRFTASADTVGEKENVAVVNASEQDPMPANNTARASTTVLPREADLVVVKLAGPAQVYVGEEITYELNVTNGGPDDATGVTLVDALPAGTTFVSASASCDESGGVVTCEVGALAPNATASFALVVRADAAGILVNTATASGDQQDPYVPNNVDTAETHVLARAAGLSIAKTGDPSTVTVGENVTYVLLVENAGPTSATNVTVVDTLPAGLAFVSANASCDAVGPQVTCALGSLAVGANASVTIIARAEAAGEHVNTATVTADEADPFPLDNTATETTLVVTAAPDGLTCVARRDGSVHLTWNAVEGALSYDVYRDANGTSVLVGATTATSYTDNTTGGAANLSYHVRAVSIGESASSEPCEVEQGPCVDDTATAADECAAECPEGTPVEECETEIPFFPNMTSLVLGGLGALAVVAVMWRRRA